MSLKKYDFCLEVGVDPSKRVTYHTFCGENLRNGVFFTSYSTLQSLAHAPVSARSYKMKVENLKYTNT